MDFNITLREILATSHFKDIAKVLVGSESLDRKVNWVHILEIRDDITKCVNGNELVLTTGIGFENTDIALEFVRQLIEKNVAGLCIETVYYYKVVPQVVIDFAKDNDFPLIILTKATRFIDITRDINTTIISNSTKVFQHADYFEHQLKFLSVNQSLLDSLLYTAKYLNLHIAYFPYNGHPYFSDIKIGAIIQKRIKMYQEEIKEDRIFFKENFIAKNIKVIGKPWGILAFYSNDRDLSQFDILILDRLSDKLEHDIMKEMVKKEESFKKDHNWIKQWLLGQLRDSEILAHLEKKGILYRNMEAQVFLLDIYPCDSSFHLEEFSLYEDFVLHTNAIVREIFEDVGLSLLGCIEENIFIYVLLAPKNMENIWSQIENAIEVLRGLQNRYIDYSKAHFALGKIVEKSEDLRISYDTARTSMDILKRQHKNTAFFDRLYIDRVLYELDKGNILADFICDHLGDLIRPENRELLHTLQVFFECNCSKQKTAENLYVVRQTLYFRLQKIGDILGSDFDTGEKRFALEFSIHAYLYSNR